MTPKHIVRRSGWVLWALALVWLLSFIGFLASMAALTSSPAYADESSRYRSDLVRIAHAGAGLDAPVAIFAAQIHQESGWNPQAVSKVGARGMAQFMPATAKWWCTQVGQAEADCLPSNPVWAMRALVGYDIWLFERVRGESEYDRWWAALRSYNGGLGHWQMEAAAARPAKNRESIDAACGKARRAAIFCRENLDYPRRILQLLQPRYLTWGRGVSL